MLYLPRDTPECCIFHTHKHGGALSVILYFLVVWLGAIFSSTPTTAIFGDQDISNCLCNLFLVELIGLVWLVLAIYNVMHMINRAVLVELCLNSVMFRRSVSVYTVYF